MKQQNRMKKRKGQVLLEYILLVSLITITSLSALSVLSDTIGKKIKEVSDFIQQGKPASDSTRFHP